MNFKKYHVSRNLLSEKYENRSINGVGAFVIDSNFDLWIGEVVAGQIYTISNMDAVYGFFTAKPLPNTGATYNGSRGYESSGTAVVTVPSGCTWIAVRVSHNADNAMLNTGSTPLPYEPYSSEVWHDIPHYIHNTSTDTLTTLPAVLYPTGTTATVGLKGNMYQASGVSPDNPIMPQGTGERTGNLFDGVYSDISGTLRYRPIFVGDGTFTLSTTTPYDSSVANVFLLSGNVSSGASTPGNGAWKNHNVTAQSVDGYVTIAYRHYSGTTSPVDCQTMLNTGSTALPYEPYGYKIPISSANTTTPVYLGEVETTRRVKKLVFDGTEKWQLYNRIASVGGKYFNLSIATQERTEFGKTLCSHYTIGNPYDRLTACCVTVNYSRGIDIRVNNPSTDGNIADFKSYLADQYAAGTPITVWYVLAEPTTGIVNEPLMRIGDYADTLSNVSIPVTAGGDTLSVDTTVQPSEVTVNYKGWHPVADVHERESGAWT